MAYNMSTGHSRRELVRAQVIARLGEEAAQQLFPPTTQDTPVTVPVEAHGYDWLRNEQFERLAVVDEWLGDSFLNWGSNNWVVHGSRTATGKPLLANDMHLDLQMPSVWYENGLHGGRFDGVGFTFPGVPLIVIGHNQHIAWGITNLNADTLDFYLERLDDPEDPTQYEFMGEWHDLEVLEEQIKVRGRDEPIQWDIRFTRNGPLINDVFLDVPEDAQPMSLRWTLYEGNDIFKSIAQINAATNWEQFRAGLEYWDNPGQNFVYADVEGNIGYQATGKLPIRVPEHQGIVPMPGWTDQYDWQGFIPFDELPSVFNPPAGFVASANNKPVPDDYPYLLSYYWVPGFRLRRIVELLDSDELLTVEDMQNMQAQTYSPPAEALRPYLLAVEPENDLQAEALAEVQAWDLRNEIDRVGASIYEVWYRFLVRNTVGDELSQGQDGEALLDRYLRCSDRHVVFLIELMDEADSVWFDDVNTPEVETRENIVRRSLADAVNWLTERYGASTDRWQWGQLHTMTFVHTPLGESGIGLVEYIFNSKTVPAPGGYYMLNMGAWGTDSFEMRFGTSQRFVVDMGDLDNALAVNTTGQSEHLYNSHREDMISMWQRGQYHPLFFAREVVEANAEAVLTLTP
jgi:penicillin amidase